MPRAVPVRPLFYFPAQECAWGVRPLRANHLRKITARVELAIHCNWLVTKDLHQFLLVATRLEFVVERLELGVARVREHFRRELRIRRGAAWPLIMKQKRSDRAELRNLFLSTLDSSRTETALFFLCYLRPHCFFPVVYNGGEADSPFSIAPMVRAESRGNTSGKGRRCIVQFT